MPLSNPTAIPSQPAWSAPILGNNWVAYGIDSASPGYYKDSFGRVHLRGSVKAGTGTQIFQLPSGFRPDATLHFLVIANSSGAFGGGWIAIASDGAVLFFAGNNALVSLDSISFRAL